MDAYQDLCGIAIEFSANGKDYDLSFEEFAVHGNQEVYLVFDHNAGARNLMVVDHPSLDRAQIQQLRAEAKKPEHLQQVAANPATRLIPAGDSDINSALLVEKLGPTESTPAPQAAAEPAKAPENVQKGMIASGPVTFKL